MWFVLNVLVHPAFIVHWARDVFGDDCRYFFGIIIHNICNLLLDLQRTYFLIEILNPIRTFFAFFLLKHI